MPCLIFTVDDKDRPSRERFAKAMQIVMEVGRLFLFRILLTVKGSTDNIKPTLHAVATKLDGKLRHHVKHCILGNKREVNERDFDVSTLIAIIRNGRVLDQQDEPTKGWGKHEVHAQNVRKGDDIERIRLIRNSLCHSTTAAMTEGDFEKLVADMTDIVHRWYKETGNLLANLEDIVGKSLSGDEIDDILLQFVEETKHDLSLDIANNDEKPTELQIVVSEKIPIF